MAINFVKNDDIRILRDIEQYYSTQIDEMPMNGEAAAHGPVPGPQGFPCGWLVREVRCEPYIDVLFYLSCSLIRVFLHSQLLT